MPFFGDVNQFESAVISVLGQSDPNWKLVIIDDCFPDRRPQEFVRSLADPRITYVINDKNLGISENFQKCVSLANTEFTTIMGCDDILLPNYVERVKLLFDRHPTVDYIQPGVAVIDDKDLRAQSLTDRFKSKLRNRHPPRAVLTGEDLAKSLLRGNWTYFPSICWKTDVLQHFGFQMKYRIVLDLALQLEIIFAGGSLLIDDVVTFEYRRHALSASTWAAKDGTRFAEESALFAEARQQMSALDWKAGQRQARWHFSSRVNALTKISSAVLARDTSGVFMLLKHVFGN